MTVMCRYTMLLFALVLAPVGPLVRPAKAEDYQPARMDFAVYAAGLNVLNLRSDVTLRPQSYRVDLNLRTTGLFGAFLHSEINSFVQGGWNGNTPSPVRFASWGVVRSELHNTILDYHAGQPTVTALEPPEEEDRDPVPPAAMRDTVDTLSAMAMLVRAVATTGRCEGHVVTFDGRRVLNISAHTAGTETLAAEGRSSFAGPALRCDFDGIQTAGFQHDESEAELHRVRHSSAWLAQILPGAPPLPVRVVFETHYFGHATAYLTSIEPLPATGPTVSGVTRTP